MLRIVRTTLLLATLCVSLARGELAYRAVAPGIERADATTHTSADAPPMAVWIYRPAARIPAGSLPCVLIAPAGSNGLTGMKLSEEDSVEHLPYVKQGFVVIAYEIDGAIGRGADGSADAATFIGASKAFVRADGGVANFRAALDLATRDEPAIDAGRVYVAGHSSAGTLALRVAAELPGRVRGVLAYAPASDLVARIGTPALDAIDASVPGIKRLIVDREPIAEAEKIRCPTMLFHAVDDDNVPIGQTRALADRMKKAGNEPLVVEEPKGGHYDAMLLRGLDAGAAWLANRAERDAAAKPTTAPAR